MPYQVAIQEYPDHIRVQLSGELTLGLELQDALSVWSQVAEACREKDVTRVLAISTASGRLPTMTAYELAASAEEWGWDRRFKLAVVVVHEERRKNRLFAETVAYNRGFRAKIFDDEQKARSWLLET
jgi:hypothetical protein